MDIEEAVLVTLRILPLTHCAVIKQPPISRVVLVAASIEIAEKNGIEVTIEKRREFLTKVAGEILKNQRSENVQQSLKIILHRQGS